jgi:hypothetical protein
VIVVIVATAATAGVHVVATEGLRLCMLSMLLILDGILTSPGDEGALHHRVVSAMYTYQMVAAAVEAADVVTGLANAADLLLLGVLGHPFVVAVVRHLRAAQGAHLDDHEDRGEHLRLAAPDLRFAAPVAPLLGRPRVAIELEVTTGHSPRVMIAEGCADLALGLLRQRTSLAHHQSGCRVLGLEAHRAVDEVALNPDHPIHGLLPHNLSEQRGTDADVPHLLKTLNHELM